MPSVLFQKLKILNIESIALNWVASGTGIVTWFERLLTRDLMSDRYNLKALRNYRFVTNIPVQDTENGGNSVDFLSTLGLRTYARPFNQGDRKIRPMYPLEGSFSGSAISTEGKSKLPIRDTHQTFERKTFAVFNQADRSFRTYL
ncbi:hypothetical protein CLF_108498 [Clonorchis sinensis]|uniref:Uncharacterized protein n=1 Tax=Clonorchis sinensis TaxID=79923 RepID=G7YI54_CLOSI|nr:hypothetical protein CLF_108498 [Clonorchis sinensis]